jgi:hypothetical protein
MGFGWLVRSVLYIGQNEPTKPSQHPGNKPTNQGLAVVGRDWPGLAGGRVWPVGEIDRWVARRLRLLRNQQAISELPETFHSPCKTKQLEPKSARKRPQGHLTALEREMGLRSRILLSISTKRSRPL